MSDAFLLSRILLRFKPKLIDLCQDLSAVTWTPEGDLWVAADETTTLERLSPLDNGCYGNHETFDLTQYLNLPDGKKGEIDIEGLVYDKNYLWLIGSHGTKRKKFKDNKSTAENIERLAEVVFEPNRYLLARIPMSERTLVRACAHPKDSKQQLTAARLQGTEDGDALIQALKNDAHLKFFLQADPKAEPPLRPLPGKDNGFDIEGLAVCGDRIFMGLRGPVLRGIAIILEVALQEEAVGELRLKPIGPEGRLYKKHFVNLDGLGVRELSFDGDDLLILAGPTMELNGSIRLFRLYDALNLEGDSLSDQGKKRLEALFDLPYGLGCDRAEGMSLFPWWGRSNNLLVVYDSPAAQRCRKEGVLADVFELR